MARRKRGSGSVIGWIVTRTILLVLVLWMASVAAVIVVGNRDTTGRADAIVVLGAAQYAGRPSPVLEARLDHALVLYTRGVAPRLIFTGGRASGDITSEAQAGARYARRHGVPDAAILLEAESRSTTEQMHAVARMARDRRFSKVVLVSDRFHMLRLLLTASRLHLQAEGSPTQRSPISLTEPAGIAYVLAESIKAPLAYLLESGAY